MVVDPPRNQLRSQPVEESLHSAPLDGLERHSINTRSTVEAYIARRCDRGNRPATINKKLRYLRAALNKAINRGYAAVNPMDSDLLMTEEGQPPRVATVDEEARLLEAA